jgi:hypothetical protein
MKTFDFDWTRFIDHVPAWESLPMPCREFFLFHCETNRRMPLRDISIDVTPLLDERFLEHAANPSYVKLRRFCLPFHRIMRIMARRSFFGEGKVRTRNLQAYLDAYLSKPDQLALGDGRAAPSRQVSQTSWLDAFLRADSFRVWEEAHRSERRTTRMLFESEDCFRKTKQIIQVLMRGANPLMFSGLQDALGVAELADYAASIRAGIAYALLFPSMHDGNLLPAIGIWPGIHERLHRPKTSRPGAAAAVEEFHRAYLMDDMTALLVACAGKPLRLREYGTELYAADARKVEANLSPLPAWLKPLSPRGHKSRVETARDALRCMGLTETMSREGGEWLISGKQGRQWLVLPPRDRLRTILDMLRERAEQEADLGCMDTPELHFMPYCRPLVYVASRPSNMTLLLGRAFGGLSTDTFTLLDEFLLYEAREANPWIERRKAGVKVADSDYGPCFAHEGMLDDELEELWAKKLKVFLAERLIPLGGARIGRASGDAILISLSDAGRYLLALAEDFEYGGEERSEILVQPNFDIVFVSPSPAAEAGVSRFAERVGRQVGTVFKLTRESIFDAFVTGLNADTVLRALAEISRKPVPGNVERQIRDWFAQCRKVGLSSAVLIRCPDKETALRVRSVGGHKLKPLSTTVLELTDKGYLKTLDRRLRQHGIAVSTTQTG